MNPFSKVHNVSSSLSPTPLWQVRIRVNYYGTQNVLNLLETKGFKALGWYECEDAPVCDVEDENGFPIASEFIVEGYCQTQPLADHLRPHLEMMAALLGIKTPVLLSCQPVDNQDWLEKCYQELSPQKIGDYYIYGSHDQDKVDVPAGFIPLQIDAATAFGSGDHPTTTGCLTALSDFRSKFSFSSILDMGCGSGILAIAAAKAWPQASVMAVDNDPESVRVTLHNAQLNHCETIQCVLSHGFEDPLVQQKAPFTLIVANILAKPLCEMAFPMHQCLALNGVIVLSGLLQRQQDQVLLAYQQQGLQLKQTYHFENWVTLVLTCQK